MALAHPRYARVVSRIGHLFVGHVIVMTRLERTIIKMNESLDSTEQKLAKRFGVAAFGHGGFLPLRSYGSPNARP
jgi:hypothetical protein